MGQPCPALASGSGQTSLDFEYEGFDVYVMFTATYDLVQPDSRSTYVLAQLESDHSASAPGPQNPPRCGHAERHVCFVLRDAEWFDAQMTPHPMNFERFWGIAWQDLDFGCFGDLPVAPATWGGVRILYR